MKRHLFSPPTAVILLLGTALSVFLYNAWSYGCGRCSIQTFLTLGPAALGLAGANALALAALIILRRRRRIGLNRHRCRCGAHLATGWRFCPGCGLQASDSPP